MISHILARFASPLAKDVARLLRDDPGGWEAVPTLAAHPFKIRYRSGLVVWIANKAFGLHLEVPGGGELWQVTAWCLLGGSPNQWAVWLAYLAWPGRTEPARAVRANIAPFADPVAP